MKEKKAYAFLRWSFESVEPCDFIVCRQ